MDKDKSIKLSCNPDTRKGHHFHKSCVQELKEKGHRRCPQCRAEVPELQASRISIPNIAREKLEVIWYSERMIEFMGELLRINNIEEVIPKLITIFTPFHDDDDPGYVRIQIDKYVNIFSNIIASYWSEIHAAIKSISDTIHTQKGKITQRSLGNPTKKKLKDLFLYIFSHLNIIKFFFQNIPESLMEKINYLKTRPILETLIPTQEEIITRQDEDTKRMIYEITQ